MSDHCELCLNPISTRVFPCLYHCKKRLCIQHLMEHEKSIEKQINDQKQLEILWKDYSLNFNEKKMFEEFIQLKTKLFNYQKLKEEINQLLGIHHFEDSIDNSQKFEKAIQTIQKAMDEEQQSTIDTIHPKIEPLINEESDTDFAFSSNTTDEESEMIDSLPSDSNFNGNSSPDDEYSEPIDEFDDHGNSVEMDDDDDEDNTSLRDQTNITPSRRITASKLRGPCPLTHDDVYGIHSAIHGIRLCPNRSPQTARTYRLHRHFLGFHHLTPLASLALARAIGSGQDPTTTKLFSDHHIILNIDELRTVSCPMHKPFLHYPLLQIENLPCDTIKQVRHLKDHLRRVHKFTIRAANVIMKSIKADEPIHRIQFPEWFNIIENDS